MRENKFRVYYEYVIFGEIHKGIESEASWFLLTQSGELLQHGPLSPLRDCNEYKKLIPLFYTGLKDSKGVDIYEGDILKAHHPDHLGFFIGEVRFNVELLTYYFDGPRFDIPMNEFEDFEIIGNIYENPELLPKTGKE